LSRSGALRLMVRVDAWGRMLRGAESVLRGDTLRGDGWLLPSDFPSLRVGVVKMTGGCVESFTPRSGKGGGGGLRLLWCNVRRKRDRMVSAVCSVGISRGGSQMLQVRGCGCDNRLRWVGRRWMRLRNRTFPSARVGARVDIVRATTCLIEPFCPAGRKGRGGRRKRRGGAASGNIPLRHVAFGIAVVPIGNREYMRKNY
jgi:hypothetical protein